jgi:hypothetical protein
VSQLDLKVIDVVVIELVSHGTFVVEGSREHGIVTVFVAQNYAELVLCPSKPVHGSEGEYVATETRWSELASFESHISRALDLYSSLKFVGSRDKGQSGDNAMNQLFR